MTEYTNQRELRVIGMSRSGNHAIIQWIINQFPRGRYCFLNAVQANFNPFLTAQPLTSPDGDRAIANYSEFHLQQEQAGRLTPKDLLIYSHEDEFLGRVCHPNFERYHDGFVGASRSRHDVLILRDPFNLFASRLRANYGWVSPQVAMRIWKQHAREFLRRSCRLPYGPVLVSYNHWAASRDYRQGIAHALGLRFSDAGFDTVATCAGGSSFDGVGFNGRASQMDVLNRWRTCRHDPAYVALFDEQVFDLSKQIFGHIPGTQALMQRTQMTRAG